jgi:hypothetical protein
MGWFDRRHRRASPTGREAPSPVPGADRPELPSIRTPLYPGYVWRRQATTRALTDRYIPAAGPAPVLQAELVRAVDKLWFEGQDNGNINWDDDFECFCDLLEEHLLAPGVLGDTDRAMAAQSLAIVRDCGRQAYVQKPEWARHPDYTAIEDSRPGLLATPIDTTDVRLAYTFDDLYQHLMDCVALFAERHPTPIAYTAPPGFRR